MANLIVKDASGNNVEVKATGTGTNADPLILQRVTEISGNPTIAGAVAHDSPRLTTTPGNPVLIGGVARNSNAIVPVADNDVSLLRTTLDGTLLVQGGASTDLEDLASFTVINTTETTMIAAVAGARHVLQSIIIVSDAYANEIVFRDATGGTVRFGFKLPTNSTLIFTPPDGWAARSVNSNWTFQIIGTANSTYPTKIYAKSFRRFF
jgi:hypothetical protein